MQIIDAQIHLWSKGAVVPPHRTTPYLLHEALRDMDAAGVHGAVIHPPSWDPAAHGLAIEAARLHPQRFAILGRIPLDEPQRRGEIETWRQQPGMLGLRYTFLAPHMQSWPSDGTMDWLWPAAEHAGIPVALLATDFLPLVGEIAQRHPRLKLIVDHMAVPPGSRGTSAYRFQPELLALAKYPNVAVKATGQPGYAEDTYPFRSFHQHLHRCFDAFGADRMFWGTDITRMPCSWRQCVTVFTEELPWLNGRDLELVMGEALCNWVGWRLAG